jgi:hypothetical protein
VYIPWWSASSSGSMLSGTTRDWTYLNEQCGVHGLLAKPPGDNLKWKALCCHAMPTEYADYVTFVFGYVHVWCCHKFVFLLYQTCCRRPFILNELVHVFTEVTVTSGLCGFLCTSYCCGFYVNSSHPWGLGGEIDCICESWSPAFTSLICEQICIMAFFSMLWTVLNRKTGACTCM